MAQQPKKPFFKAGKVSASEERAETINSAARTIIDTEAAARERKTARLKELRLQKEAEEKAVNDAKPAKPVKSRKATA